MDQKSFLTCITESVFLQKEIQYKHRLQNKKSLNSKSPQEHIIRNTDDWLTDYADPGSKKRVPVGTGSEKRL